METDWVHQGKGKLPFVAEQASYFCVGKTKVFLFDLIPTGRYRGRDECILTSEESLWIKELRERYAALDDFPRIIHQTLFASIAYPCAAEGCPAGNVYLHIEADGTVTPCDFTPISFGNVRKKPLREIWKAMVEDATYIRTSPTCRYKSPEFRERVAREESNPVGR